MKVEADGLLGHSDSLVHCQCSKVSKFLQMCIRLATAIRCPIDFPANSMIPDQLQKAATVGRGIDGSISKVPFVPPHLPQQTVYCAAAGLSLKTGVSKSFERLTYGTFVHA